ncbi:MAG: bifunctional pyr operon transcriptional regulator/uracil phosphoribosyltransferase PyrR [Actinomycetota bacterium]
MRELGEANALSKSAKAEPMDARDLTRALARIAHEILERNKGASDLVLIGLLSRGEHLAARLAENIASIEGVKVPTGSLDIALYRDDIGLRAPSPIKDEELPPVDGKVVVLVDDVLYTGRSVRAAMDALMDIGRPKAVQLAVLVDRGHRELPIRADFVGKNIPTARGEQIEVHVLPMDEEDAVRVIEGEGVRGTQE